MSIDMSQFYQVFFDEAAEHLAEMERLLLGLDVEAPRMDDLNAIFRAAHSIKGGSGTFGFTDMAATTHVLESLLDKLRKEELALVPEMVDAFLQAGDAIKSQLAAHRGEGEADVAAAEAVAQRLQALAGGSAAPAPAPAAMAVTVASPVPGQVAGTRALLLTFPFVGKAAGFDKLCTALADLGEVEVVSKPAKAGRRKTPVQCQLKLVTAAQDGAIREPFEFICAGEELAIAPAPSTADYGFINLIDNIIDPKAQGEAGAATQVDPGYGFFEAVQPQASGTAADLGYGFFDEVQPQAANVPADDVGYGFFEEIKPVEAAPAATPVAAKPVLVKGGTGDKPAAPAAAASPESSSIRVSVEKVDQMINLVGELVITQAMLAQTASQVDPVLYEKLLNGMAQLERNTRDLQESVMSIRMMPISFVFSRFPRVVRDLAAKLGKQVELKTIGEGTELDKGVIEKIADPLTHLVRNSLDHGIEMPEQRAAAGKPEKGTITLRAFHQGGNIVVEVRDDGGGLNRDKILGKAKERGLPVSDSMSDQEVWQLIFEAGFSTAEVVTDVSGRGVGMDVVRKNIKALGGRVEIESQLGVGTCISIRLPLTLAILDGMSIAVGRETFIIPLTYIAESLQPMREDVKTVAGKGQVLRVRGEYLPLVALHEIFRVSPRTAEIERGIVVILEAEGCKTALLVDELLGQHQVVIKSLESNYRKVDGISGATIMGDGKVALILDVAEIVRMSQQELRVAA